MKKLKMETKDLTQENIEKIGKLFPNVITEMQDENGKLKKGINFELLKQELSGDVVDGEEHYDFTWVGKMASMVEGNTPIRKTLRPCIEESKDWETTGNLYIEGDNLDVLKLLQESYLNKIKMIYIDPPYNTGKDFIYRDNFSVTKVEYDDQIGILDEEKNRLFQNTDSNGRFHSDWCSMMYPRLKLAQSLLSEDGVIFISIDDNEVRNIRNICDEIFGEDNYVATISTLCNPKGRAQDKHFATNHEFILIYSKNQLPKGSFSVEKDIDQVNMEYTEEDEFGKYRTLELRNTHREFGRFNRKNLFYPLYVDSQSGKVSLDNDINSIEVFPTWEDGFDGCWTWGKQKSEQDLDFLIGKITSGKWKIYVKDYADGASKMLKTILINKEYFTEKGQKTFNELFQTKQKIFQSPKSLDLLKLFINTQGVKTSIILDFFSGSATSAHAVMQLNAEDGGNRKFIMVQLQEPCNEESEAFKAGYKNICEIGKERIRRAGEKIKVELAGSSSQLKFDEEEKKPLDIGFRVLKVDSTNMKDVYYSADEYNQEMLTGLESNIKEDRTDLDLLYGILLEWGLPLSLSHKIETIAGVKIHTVDEGSLVACFAEKVSENVVREIANRQPLRAVFRDSSFSSSPEKINVEEIFKLHAPNTSVRVI